MATWTIDLEDVDEITLDSEEVIKIYDIPEGTTTMRLLWEE